MFGALPIEALFVSPGQFHSALAAVLAIRRLDPFGEESLDAYSSGRFHTAADRVAVERVPEFVPGKFQTAMKLLHSRGTQQSALARQRITFRFDLSRRPAGQFNQRPDRENVTND